MRLKLAVIIATACAAAAFPAGASAAPAATPPALDFGSQTVGTTSGAQQVQLITSCSHLMPVDLPPAPPMFICTSTPVDAINVAVSATGDFAATSNCPPLLAPAAVGGTAAACQISVTFTPTATGARTGTLSTGTVLGGPGPQVSLSGTGAAPAATGGSAGAVGGSAKKCKKKGKKKSAAAAKKKCKKGKKKGK